MFCWCSVPHHHELAQHHWPTVELVPGILDKEVPLRHFCNFWRSSRKHPGAVWGQLLFHIYMNDLPECIDYATCYLFADDTKLLKTVTNLNDELQLQQDLNTLNGWCKEWKLDLNIDKCSTLRLALSNRSTQQLGTYSIIIIHLGHNNVLESMGSAV